MKNTMTFKTLAATLLLALFLTACGGSATDEAAAPAATAEEDHEHGPGTHTHDMTTDTAGTYVDTTGAFFGDEDAAASDHEHGPDTHEH